MSSPFANLNTSQWASKRNELIEEYPLDLQEVRDLVLKSYSKLLETRIGDPSDDIRIFEDVLIGAQTTGAFLETIIANEIQEKDSVWRQGSDAEKDLVHTENPRYSTEIKMSGQVNDEIFGNRSFAQDSGSEGKKNKSGYYLTSNIHISEEFFHLRTISSLSGLDGLTSVIGRDRRLRRDRQHDSHQKYMKTNSQSLRGTISSMLHSN